MEQCHRMWPGLLPPVADVAAAAIDTVATAVPPSTAWPGVRDPSSFTEAGAGDLLQRVLALSARLPPYYQARLSVRAPHVLTPQLILPLGFSWPRVRARIPRPSPRRG